MSESNNEIWNAAGLSDISANIHKEQSISTDIEWKANGLIYKLLEVSRITIDEDEDESNAHLLIGLDSGDVLRVDVLLDTAYGREISDLDAVREAAETAPKEASKILNSYLA